MPRSQEQYALWSTHPFFDAATRDELRDLAQRPDEIEDRFYADLVFGTGGLRGVIGAGTNRINRYTVALVSTGFARTLAARGPEACRRGIVIAYDSRRFSADFALLTALVFVGQGIRVFLSDELRPVPVLSFAVRHLGAVGGVMITASHNPAQYNGYKAYGEDGGQLPPDDAAIVIRAMADIGAITNLSWPDETTARATGLLTDIGADLDAAYQAMLLGLSINRAAVLRQHDLKIVYTPLHGAGNKPVRRVLAGLGFTRVLVVPEQEQPDAAFPTVSMPNPEERAALTLAIDLAAREDADLVIATDPDGDRVGLSVRDRSGAYHVLTGNQIGLLLADYILSAKQAAGTLLPGSFIVTTIVSTKLTRRVAAHYGVMLYECLTGFKFIGELIKEHDEQGNEHFQFGFEESFGFLAGTQVRDKDAVVTSMLIAEMAAVARERGLTLFDLLQDLFRRFGYAAEQTISVTLEGREGLQQTKSGMDRLRQAQADGVAGLNVRAVNDYLRRRRLILADGRTEALDLPESDVLLYELDGLDWFCVRPSGTEPKVKIYFGCTDEDETACHQRLAELRRVAEQYVRRMLA
jgi:phosphoglucomutase